MAISKTKGQGRRAIPIQYRKASDIGGGVREEIRGIALGPHGAQHDVK